MMNSIVWPKNYQPGKTDNFVSNEVIVAGLTSQDVWLYLQNAYLWPSYYKNASDVVLSHGKKYLVLGEKFSFKTFGFPIDAEIMELNQPQEKTAARIAWHGWTGEKDTRLDVYHAWLIEDLPDHRVRILTQETQIGLPAQALAKVRPNPMLNGHQAWLDGLVEIALSNKTN
ncbi:SRPBCC family protein [Acinetobacter baretiae]|uniref:SRPBCC domain-containing protein n=1 Tax=Acinetobacter baretiae TaxID=2605383 RepID=UPI001B3CA1D4|nr:SRPBCC domain-containing protein [Acinetobacter baretiae]